MDLCAISFPDVPNWVGPVLWWAKWGVLAVVAVLAGIGEIQKKRTEEP